MIHAREDYNNRPLDSFIPEDEPVFLLRASDKLAPATMYFWCGSMEAEGGHPEMIRMVKEQADKMGAYGKSKLPDLPFFGDGCTS